MLAQIKEFESNGIKYYDVVIYSLKYDKYQKQWYGMFTESYPCHSKESAERFLHSLTHDTIIVDHTIDFKQFYMRENESLQLYG